MSALLSLRGVTGGYGPVTVLHDIDLEVAEGEVVVVLGANGAGKTTTLRAIVGEIATRGERRFAGEPLPRTPEKVARAGIGLVPQGRGTFAELTTEENLRLGAAMRRDADVRRDLEHWYEVFPRLRERRDQPAGSMSGGEQQMLAIARALMLRPRLLLLDEPSLGLAPRIVDQIFETLREVNRGGTAILIVEQNAAKALQLADRAYVLETGAIVMEGSGAELLASPDVRRAYLGG